MLSKTSKYAKQDDGKAIPMVNYDPSIGQFIINEDAIKIIAANEGQLGIISVAGMYRTGKSYLLNRMLLNRSKGFSVGPSINPCTKGLWMWNKPLAAHTPDGQQINAYVIDTEGIGATDEDHNHDNKIMTLAILLSSYFIFNSLGTIDENAIQNLSFITNITKNIQQKNDSADFNLYLPTFMWVIRDFVLQLKNLNGEPITSKEYLERSLELQKGSSDFIKSKNQIRQMVKNYFKERDCVTLVRPITEEGNLQNLEKMDQSKLRPEFLDQVNKLRKNVLNNIKPKKMNGNVLTGPMFTELLSSYVQMINDGAVPVIQSAWTYMCINECAKAVEQAKQNFLQKMKDTESQLPLSVHELNLLYKQYKESALKYIQDKAIGDIDPKLLDKFKADLKATKQDLSLKNLDVSTKSTNEFLAENFKDIQRKINDKEYQSFEEYKADVDNFIKGFEDKCRIGPNSYIILYEFLTKKMLEHSKMLSKQNIDELEKEMKKEEAKIKALNKKMEEVKNERQKLDKSYFEKCEKISKLDEEKGSLDEHHKAENENISKMIEEKAELITRLKEELSSKEAENKKQCQNLKAKLEKAEAQKSEKEKEHTKMSSNFEREKVLMEQKIIFLEKNLKNLQDQRNRNSLKSSLRHSLKEDSSQKEKIKEYEANIKKTSAEITKLEDNIIETETNILQKKKKIENEQNKFNAMKQDFEENLSQILADKKQINDMIFDLKNNITANEEFEEEIKAFDKQIEELNEKKKEMDDLYAEEEAKLKEKLAALNKEVLLLKQNAEISERQINEYKNQIENDKIDFDKYVKVLSENNDKLLKQYESSVKETSDLKLRQESEINNLNEENAEKIKELTEERDKLKAELENIKAKNEEKISALKEELKKQENEVLPSVKLEVANYESNIESITEDISVTKKSNKDSLEDINLDHNTKIQELLEKAREEMEENNIENEKNINALRQQCELEKEDIESKIQSLIAESQEQMQKLEEEQENKLNELEKEKNAKIDELEMNLEDLEKMHENYANEVEKEMALKMQKIESLKDFLSDAQSSYQKLQSQIEINLQNQSQQFEAEKNELLEKIRKLKEENESENEELEALKIANEEKEKSQETISEDLDELRKRLNNEKEKLEETVKALNKDLQDKVDAYNEMLNHYTKELSLKDQNIGFNNEKLNECKLVLEEFKNSCDIKIENAKEDITAEFTGKIEKAENELNDLNEMLKQVNKQIADINAKFKAEKDALNKEKEDLLSKLAEITQRKKDLTEALEKERDNSKKIIEALSKEFKDKNELLNKENEVLKIKLKKLESDYSDLNALYEKDSNLFENKFEFLKEQKEGYQSELKTLMAQYDSNMDDLQQKILAERERLKGVYTKSTKDRENAYNEQIANAENTFNSKYNEVNMQNKNLMIENKTLRDKIQNYENSFKANDDIQIKLTKQLENENKYKTQFESVTNTQDAKIAELNEKLKAQRENFIGKIKELESKLEEYEGKKNNANIENIKQIVTNQRNKENNVNIIQNLKGKLQALEKEQSKLLNEKKENLKEKEQLKRSSRNSSLSHNSGGSGYIPKYKLNPSFTSNNKENLRSIANNNNNYTTSKFNIEKKDDTNPTPKFFKKSALNKSLKIKKNEDDIKVENMH